MSFLFVRSFDASESRVVFPLSAEYSRCEPSPDRTKLLLSSSGFDGGKVTGLNLEDKLETEINASGRDATWVSDSSIIFVREEWELWVQDLDESQPRQVLRLEGRRKARDLSWTLPPVVTDCGPFVLWSWTVQRTWQTRQGSVLIDLEAGRYRQIEYKLKWATFTSAGPRDHPRRSEPGGERHPGASVEWSALGAVVLSWNPPPLGAS